MVARQPGVSRQAASRWHGRWKTGGPNALRSRGPTGPTPRLSDDQLAQVEQALKQGATANGSVGELWTLERIATVIERRTGVRHHPAHVWAILSYQLGWSVQRPCRLASERDQAAIDQWVAASWPRIRKTSISALARKFANESISSRYSYVMRPLRYSINVTLDGCCDHRAMFADEDLHRHAVENLVQADALLFGRVTYEMMEAAWRPPAPTGARPDWMEPFARTIDAAKKYVVSSTLDRVDWNAELLRGDLRKAVQQLKRESGKGLFVGGVKLPLALTELGLIDEYEFVVQPRLAGHGPTLFAGLSKHVDLKLMSRLEFGSGAVAMRYEPRR